MNQSNQTPHTRRMKRRDEQKNRSQEQEETLTRRQLKKKRKEEKRMNRRPRRRIFPIWLRLIVVIALCIAGLAGGLMIGYGVLGEGEPKDVLSTEVWQHIIDIIAKEK